jgi:DNA repair ATPase RecN
MPTTTSAYGPDQRYVKLAEALLSAPDPVMAIAHELGDQHGRIDALGDRLHSLEARVTFVSEMSRRAS